MHLSPEAPPQAAGPEAAGPEFACPEAAGPVVRFDRVQRTAHWATAVLFLVLIFTGAALYVPALVGLVGRRVLVTDIHVYCGLALPLPLLVSLAGPWGRALREDLGRLNRWSQDDGIWLSTLLHRGRRALLRPRVGKFNAGQKLNAAFTGGVIVVMLATGSVMHWDQHFPLSWRTGATFVHDLTAYLLVVAVAGHIVMALVHPAALRSMITGKVSHGWARLHAPAWHDEISAGVPVASPGPSREA
ncbi:MAG TPA: cytochrome b/b6 domain-containing protein [Acidimicrobiales bacterium]|nr:cytochrome b/b6 domain-containing protein [Acidimicrobiales bacterium]